MSSKCISLVSNSLETGKTVVGYVTTPKLYVKKNATEHDFQIFSNMEDLVDFIRENQRGRKGFMNGIVLITASKTATEDIYLQWKEEGKHIGFEPNQLGGRLGMEIKGGSIYAYSDSTIVYEDGELSHVNIFDPYFYAICYTDPDVMEYFMEKTKFPEDSYMDNDQGSILSLEEVRKDISGFLELEDVSLW